MHNSIFLAFLCTLLGNAQCGIFDDPCHIMPQGPRDENTTMDIQVDPNCNNGTFWWNYPRGGIRLHFQYSSSFQVCLKDDVGGAIFKLYDISSNVTHAMPSVTPHSPKEVCTSYHQYEVVILFEAPKIMYYMGMVDYRIQPMHPARF